MRPLAGAARARIEHSLAGWPRASEIRRFVETVVWQLAHASGNASVPDAQRTEEEVAIRVLGLVEAAAGGAPGRGRAMAELVADPVVLAAFFQNLDLLPAEHDPHVDAIALFVGDAVHRLSETLHGGPDAV